MALFGKMGQALADMMMLGVLWLVFSLPLFTIGASTTAVFYVTTRMVSKKDGAIWRDFWGSFRQNFVKATAIWVILALILLLLIFNIQNIWILDGFRTVFYVFQIILMAQLVFVMIYAFPLLSRLEMTIGQLLRTAIFMAHRHFLTTLINLGLMALIFVTSWQLPFLFLFFMGIYSYFSSFLLMKIFKKYRPDIDPEEHTIEVFEPLNLDVIKKAQEDKTNDTNDFSENS
ncbi:MAG: DUF624 domain-containing protein [Defluviitaleaceae bacterium]|nr:DUF624 domain-containing protein [Defluviitaleaceae bacterium]